ncbi:MAG: hypothetical protein IKN72_06225 [Clostridia bacterium]|nr:hypothetical protein [Clostridia bacterium]
MNEKRCGEIISWARRSIASISHGLATEKFVFALPPEDYDLLVQNMGLFMFGVPDGAKTLMGVKAVPDATVKTPTLMKIITEMTIYPEDDA